MFIKSLLSTAFIFIALCVGFLGIPALIFGGFICKKNIYDEHLSPNYKAVVIVKDCGAAVNYKTHISLMKTKSFIKFKQSFLILDGHPRKVAPDLLWENENTLRVKLQLHGYERKAKKNIGWFKKITIEYDNN